MKADFIMGNANVLTLDPFLPKAEWIAVHNKEIIYVGKKDYLSEFKGRNTVVIDCGHKTILPGFIDAHCHLQALAESLVNLHLGPSGGVKSIVDIQGKINNASRDLPPGTWIRAGGYDEFHLLEKRHPGRWDLDRATLDHPVKLTHRSGHAHVLNSLALKRVNVFRETADPAGGLIERDSKTGEPTGVLYGMGEYLAERIPSLDHRDLERGIRLANQEMLSHGITSLQDVSPRNGIQRWRLFERWKENQIIRPRLNLWLGIEAFDEFQIKNGSVPMDGDMLRVGGVKIVIHETTGQLSPSQEDLKEIVLKVHQSGRQVALHAVEESTIEAACSAIDFALSRYPRDHHRHRIEHCSICPPPLAERLASLGVIVVTQPAFLYYHGERYLATVPTGQLTHLYPLATLLKRGVQVASGSDCPIAPVNPLIGIFSAVSRTAQNGQILSPEEKISLSEAVRMHTINAAHANFEENKKGSITVGKWADFVVLNEDPTQVPVAEIKNIAVEMTVLNGELVWSKATNQ